MKIREMILEKYINEAELMKTNLIDAMRNEQTRLHKFITRELQEHPLINTTQEASENLIDLNNLYNTVYSTDALEIDASECIKVLKDLKVSITLLDLNQPKYYSTGGIIGHSSISADKIVGAMNSFNIKPTDVRI